MLTVRLDRLSHGKFRAVKRPNGQLIRRRRDMFRASPACPALRGGIAYLNEARTVSRPVFKQNSVSTGIAGSIAEPRGFQGHGPPGRLWRSGGKRVA